MLPKEISGRADQSEPRAVDGFSQEDPSAKAPPASRNYPGRAATAIAGMGVLVFLAAAFYRVRELLAALLLFSVLFGVVVIAVSILWFVERGAHEAAARLETQLARIPVRRIFATARAHSGHTHRNPPWN